MGSRGEESSLDYEVLVIGGGLSGCYALHRMRQQGARVRLLEAGDAVGGTWYVRCLEIRG